MTIYKVRDRQGVKFFAEKPTFNALHDFFEGKNCRKPKKGDRIIKRMTCNVNRQSQLARDYYPPRLKVGYISTC